MPKISQDLLTEQFLDTYPFLVDRKFWISVFMIAIIIPLSFLRSLDSLKYSSMVALLSIAYLAILVLLHFFRNDLDGSLKGDISIIKPKGFTSTLSSFPIVVFAYTCHQNMFSIINELPSKKMSIITRIIAISIGIAMLLYISVGLTGYLTFGDLVSGNIIVMYPKSISTTFGRFAIVILVMLSYPLQCHPCRMSTNHILHYIQTRKIEYNSLTRSTSFASSVFSKFNQKFRTYSTFSFNGNNTNNNTGTANNIPGSLATYRETLLSQRHQPFYNPMNESAVSDDASSQFTDNSSGIFIRAGSHSHLIYNNFTANYNSINPSGNGNDNDTASNIAAPSIHSLNPPQNNVTISLPTRKFVIITTSILIVSFIISISVTSLEKVLAFVGSTGSTTISFILPGIFGFKLIGNKQFLNTTDNDINQNIIINDKQSKKDQIIKYAALFLSIWGIIVMIVCLTSLIFLKK
ncbi:uncharacterized protein ASCRUDRAFT_75379 [Ascoidea rubescens DSM 1968]|uniref:Amino acid transporter transmembrane domain-containing protein n=1 Tax=Ascoidea rubescens DSM 1968 TaxID=1344418 RepID=A0A1D2VI81_9ASCO|nr:hypothetical protein ASCRUDRAFT_75379 [Ascoidea rubescens DSM 1968]ODV61356.1 hypothetical protein ASCRUDRAFT_75379 [Ascoidea rubescens DSM 1968]